MSQKSAVVVIKLNNGGFITYCHPGMTNVEADRIVEALHVAVNEGRDLELPNGITVPIKLYVLALVREGICNEEGGFNFK